MNYKLLIISLFLSGKAFSGTLLSNDNGIQVDEIDADIMLNNLQVEQRADFLHNRQQVEKFLKKLYLNKVLAEQARQQGLGKPPREKAELQMAMDNQYINLLLRKLYKQIEQKDFTALARQEYQVHKEKYRQPVQADVSHIMVDKKKQGEQKARKLIEDLRSRLQKGEDFETLAQKYSDDRGARENKGHIGLVEKGKILPEFDKVIFTMNEAGEISDVIESERGYHLLKLNKKILSHVPEFSEIKGTIIASLKKDYFEQEKRALLEDAEKRHTFKLDEKAIDTFIEKNLQAIERKKTAVE